MSRKASWLPRTLFGRNLLLIVALVALGQLASGAIWYTQVQRPRVDRAAAFVLWHAGTVRTTLARVPPADRDATIAELNRLGRNGVRIADVAPDTGDIPLQPVARLFMRRLQERIGTDYQLSWQVEPERRLWVRLNVDGRTLWCGYSADGLMPDISGLVLGLSITVMLLAFVGAAVIQRHLNAPLRALARAAGDVALGRKPQLPDERAAPEEIAVVAHSFAQMSTALDDLERERALMLAGVSHDLRTPLTKLRLGLEMLDNPAEADLIASMVRSIETADAVIDQFIDYARIGHDEAMQTIDLNALVRHAVQAVLDPRLDIALELGELPQVLARPVAAERLVTNLLQNAMRHGAPPFVVRTECDGARARLVVQDHGPGIPEAEIDRLRRPFAQLDTARGGKPGAGLGLAIADRVARLHGGELGLRNRAEGGLEASVGFACVSLN